MKLVACVGRGGGERTSIVRQALVKLGTIPVL